MWNIICKNFELCIIFLVFPELKTHYWPPTNTVTNRDTIIIQTNERFFVPVTLQTYSSERATHSQTGRVKRLKYFPDDTVYKYIYYTFAYTLQTRNVLITAICFNFWKSVKASNLIIYEYDADETRYYTLQGDCFVRNNKSAVR